MDAGKLAELRGRLHPPADPFLADSVRAARLSLNPELARQAEREAAYVASYGKRKARDGRMSGWRKGTPQCPSCRRILTQKDGWCPSCRTFAGRHDHGR